MSYANPLNWFKLTAVKNARQQISKWYSTRKRAKEAARRKGIGSNNRPDGPDAYDKDGHFHDKIMTIRINRIYIIDGVEKMKRTDQYTEEALKAIARIAIIDSRRSRFIEFASTSKGIEKWLKDLDHFENYINMHKAISFQDGRQVFGFVKNNFCADDSGFAISTQSEYRRGVFGRMDNIISDLLGSGNGSFLLINKKQQFCLYLGEDVRSNFIWMTRI